MKNRLLIIITCLATLFTLVLNATPVLASGILTNGDFETGDLSGWTTYTTVNGQIGPAPVVLFDTGGGGTDSLAVRLNVGRAVLSAGGRCGGGITQTFNLSSPADITVSADVASQTYGGVGNMDGGIFELLVDGAVVSQFDTGFIDADTVVRGTLSASLSPVAGPHTVAVQARRNYQPSQGTPYQYFDNIYIGIPASPFNSGNSKIWVGLKNSDEAGAKFDLRAEVYNGALLVGSGEVLGVSAGSSGFNNAKLSTIIITPVPDSYFSSGDTLNLKLSVRKSGSKYSPTTRLWYDGNSTHANSSLSVTIGGNPTTYYLRSGSALSTSVGTGNPGLFIDVGGLATGGSYKAFGTWSAILP